MENEIRAKLDALLRKQEVLQEQLAELTDECQRLDNELKKPADPTLAVTIARDLEKIESSQPAVTPPPIPPELAAKSALSKATPAERKQPAPETKKPDVQDLPTALPEKSMCEVDPPEEKPTTSRPPTFNTGEWELAFGKVWMVRIGMLLLLTGLVFLSTYAYKNLILNAGPVVKVSFFMAVSVSLTIIGLWLDGWKERFRQYGRVVASGGLAAGYYTVYASHFVPSLKLVDNPILAGTLLTLWAGLMLAYAVWKKSRVVAVMAIGLAFYGTIVNPSGWISLFSALLLSSAGMWLMLKFRWVAVGLGTVAAAYVAHAFWLGFYPQSVESSVRFTYLASYWTLFTAALTVPVAKRMPVHIQRAFGAINNGAAWCLTVFLVPQMTAHEEIGWLSIGIGALWIMVAMVARSGKLWDRSLAVIFGYQGVLIASLGILIEASGYTRFLVMAVEACVLLAGARYFGGWIARFVSAVAFLCAIVTALPGISGGVAPAWQSHAALALVFAAYTVLARRDGVMTQRSSGTADNLPLLPATVTWLTVGLGVFGQWDFPAGINGMMLTSATMMLCYFLVQSPRWKMCTGDLAMTAVWAFFAASYWYFTGLQELTVWQSLIPLATMACYWFMSPRINQAWEDHVGTDDKTNSKALEWLTSIIFWISMAGSLIHHIENGRHWLVVGGLLAISGHAVAELLRRPSIGAPATVFHLGALAALAVEGHSEPLVGWLPAVFLVVHLALTDRLWNTLAKAVLRPLLGLALFIAVGVHAFQEFDRPDLTLTALALVMSTWAYRKNDPPMAMTAGVFPMVFACVFSLASHGAQDWLRYLPVGSALLMHGLLWRASRDNAAELKSWKPVRIILLLTGLMALFYASTTHVHTRFDGAGVAICWALLAAMLFCVGLSLRCRPYRLIGLWWLAAAVLHVVCIDVMKLDTLGRILSFISLGLVLLALGFLYNRFQETIRKFL